MPQPKNPFANKQRPQYVYEHHVIVGKGLPKPTIPSCVGEHKAIKAETDSPIVVIVTYDDGCQQIRRAGTLSWRNNNPGNVTLIGPESRAHGAIGFNLSKHHYFAIYPDEETGRRAILSMFQESSYQKLTLSGAFYYYAPPKDGNDTAAYVKFVVEKTGIPPETPISSLSQEQMLNIANAIKIHEGWRPGVINWKQGEE